MSSKTCFKCGIEKVIGEFYKHSMMADGHLNKCKSCTKSDVKSHRDTNLEDHILRDRKRYDSDERRAGCIARAKARNARCRDAVKISKDKWLLNNKEKRKAHNLVNNKIATYKPDSCESCGVKSSLHGHHDDYSKPLQVKWLCTRCHGKVHRLSRESVASNV